jgi:CHAT domain-containing protein/thioredoxin-like negative regulator of GroEL
MNNNGRLQHTWNNICLTDDDLYAYISGHGETGKLSRAEAHFLECSACRESLAQLLEILQPKEQTEIPEPSEAELAQTAEMIRQIARKEQPVKAREPRRTHWPIALAAAAALIFVALSILGLKFLFEKHKSEGFYLQAKAVIEENYAGTSPTNMRLDLPFNQISKNRAGTSSDALRTAENFLFQALAVRDDMVEAHLALGFIYLNESKVANAQNEFKKVLNARKDQPQALLGFGVAQYEEAVQSTDPLQRENLLKSAVDSFDSVLKSNPRSAEARYDKILALYESGRHEDALREVDTYLSRDTNSVWAEKLKGLKIKMQATQRSSVDKLVENAGQMRDQDALVELSRQAPYVIPSAIWSAMRNSLAREQALENGGKASSEDLRWAAETMERAYSAETGDHTFRAFIDFQDGLSPPERRQKKDLDQKFQALAKILNEEDRSKSDLILQSSKPLEIQYTKIGDYWQLANIHHLRGSCYYQSRADFRAAESEYMQIHQIGIKLQSRYLECMGLRQLAMIYGNERKFAQSIEAANKAMGLSQKYKVDSSLSQASLCIGNQYSHLGQFRLALQQYAKTLSYASHSFEPSRMCAALENAAIAYGHLGEFGKAAACYRLSAQTQSAVSKTTSSVQNTMLLRLNLLYRQGELAVRMGDLSGAEVFFLEGLKSPPPELESRIRVALSEVYLRQNRKSEAESVLNRVFSLIASGQYPESAWKAEFVKGRLLEATGRSHEALISYQNSIQKLKALRQNVSSEDLRETFLVDRYNPFKATATLLFNTGKNRQELVQTVDRSKSTTLRESLERDSMLESRWDTVSAEEDPYTKIEYFFAQDKLLILLTRKNQIETFSQNLTMEEVGRQVQKLLHSVRQNDLQTFQDMSRTLYSELLAPAESSAFAQLSGPLVILPDGPLYLLPFAGLQDKSGRFLIEKTPIAFAPSRSIFRHRLLPGRTAAAVNSGGVLLLDGSAGLPNAQNELSYISNLYGKNTSIVGTQELPLAAGLLRHTIILHFTGHAIIQQGQPALLLQKYPKETYLDCQTIRKWTMPQLQLVNLAGCNTAIGPVAEGEAPWGLIPAFMDAGAHSIMASLMEVDDAFAKTLSCRFYDLLKKGSGKARALQLAQLDLIKSRNLQSWIPYILVGDPQ